MAKKAGRPRSKPNISKNKWLSIQDALSLSEQKAFTEEWFEWIDGHFNGDEDLSPDEETDLRTICMDSIQVLRLYAAQRKDPTFDINTRVTACHKRIQQARDNLMATRSAVANSGRKGGKTEINVAVIAGEVSKDANLMKQIESKRTDTDKFLEEAPDYGDANNMNVDDIIDGFSYVNKDSIVDNLDQLEVEVED